MRKGRKSRIGKPSASNYVYLNWLNAYASPFKPRDGFFYVLGQAFEL